MAAGHEPPAATARANVPEAADLDRLEAEIFSAIAARHATDDAGEPTDHVGWVPIVQAEVVEPITGDVPIFAPAAPLAAPEPAPVARPRPVAPDADLPSMAEAVLKLALLVTAMTLSVAVGLAIALRIGTLVVP